jgi:small subunit ribosomal protein S19
MARSVKKGPYVFNKLMAKIEKANSASRKSVIKTWSRASIMEKHLFLFS